MDHKHYQDLCYDTDTEEEEELGEVDTKGLDDKLGRLNP